MSDFRQHISQRLKTTKAWLSKAEEAFEKDKDIRAELDLMLAEAELKRLRETQGSAKGRQRYFVLRHGLAFLVAAVLVVTSWSGFYWYSYKENAVQPPSGPAHQEEHAVPVSAAKPVQPVSEGVSSANTITAAPRTTAVAAPEQPQPQSAPAKQVTQETRHVSNNQPVLAPEEMQKLVRAAGKSLRGQ